MFSLLLMQTTCFANAYVSGTYKAYKGSQPYVVEAVKVQVQRKGYISSVRNDSGADKCVLLYSADGKTITTEEVGISISSLNGRAMAPGWYKIHPLPNSFDPCYSGCYMGISIQDY
jgi:hypothetical protein